MNAARRNLPPSRLASVAGLLLSVSLRRIMALVLLIAGVSAGARYAWHRWGGAVAESPAYVLEAQNIEITPPPEWVRSDVKAEVLRDGGLAGLSLLDEQLTVKVFQAFAKHTWVEDVVRVSKRDAPRLVIEITYRQPVAMVEVTMNGQEGLLPVDAHGILLPPQDFSPEQTRAYLRISAPKAAPAGAVGAQWGDPRVHGAARVAGILRNHWKQLNLHRIVPNVPTGANAGAEQITFDLLTRGGSRILWGRAPDPQNVADVSAAKKKLAKLLTYTETTGPLDSGKSPRELDLTLPKAPEPAPPQAIPATAPLLRSPRD